MAKYTPGTYEGKAKGFLEDVFVKVTVDENTMTHLEYEESETSEVGGWAIERLAERIREAGSADVDSISGATSSSKGLKGAVEQALRQAAGEPEPEKYIPGTYPVQAEGYKGTLHLLVTYNADSITDIEFEQQIETQELGGDALVQLREYVLENQDFDFDVVSGSTYTSDGFREALKVSEDHALDIVRGIPTPDSYNDTRIQFKNGRLNLEEIGLILDNLPLEITFLDKEDKFIYFNERKHQPLAGTPRSRATLGSYVLNCHPPQIRHKVGQLMEDLKSGKQRNETMWYTKSTGDKFHLTYKPLYNRHDEYIGMLEYVQNGKPFLNIAENPYDRAVHSQAAPNPFASETQEDVDAWYAWRQEKFGLADDRTEEDYNADPYSEKKANAKKEEK